jgi:7-keto-8-aminopelargonate synthetase-like enzyme
VTTQAEFIDRCVAAAADLALYFVGAPDEQMLASLHQTRTNLEADLAEAFGAEVAALIAETFCATVIWHRRELEAGGGSTPRVMN